MCVAPPRPRSISDSLFDQAIDTLDLAPRIRKKCVKSLYKMCANHTLLPASLHFDLPVDIMGDAQYRGGSANVLRRECGGREVAVKALRPHGLTLEGMKNVSCHRSTAILVRIDRLSLSLAEVL